MQCHTTIGIVNTNTSNRCLETHRGILANVLWSLPFILFFWIQLWHHELWRDELNAWGLAVASPNITSLFRNIHYEAHPSLWYVLLWVPSRFTSSPIAMKGVEAIVGTSIYLILGLGSPFSKPEKLLLFLSYFVSFEYTVLSRMYGLLLLLILIYLWLRSIHPERSLEVSCLLGLVANADTMGLILSTALLAEYACAYFGSNGFENKVSRRQLATGIVAYAWLAALSVLSLMPAHDISWRTTGRLFRDAGHFSHLLAAAVGYTVLPFFPTATDIPGTYWNWTGQTHGVVFLCVLPFVWAALFRIADRNKGLQLLLGMTMMGGVTFGYLIYFGSMRHFGILFIALIACVWLQKCLRERISRTAYVLLVLNALGGLVAAYQSWTHPFSNAGATADWIERNHIAAYPLVGTPDTSVVGIAEELRRPIYQLDCECTGLYLRYTNRRDTFRYEQIPARLLRAKHDLASPLLVYATTWRLTPGQLQSIQRQQLEMRFLAGFTGAEADHEDFYLYLISDAQPDRNRGTVHSDDPIWPDAGKR